MLRRLKLWIAGYRRLSYCWIGLHRWAYPGGYCKRCGLCDKFFGGHQLCGKTCLEWKPPEKKS